MTPRVAGAGLCGLALLAMVSVAFAAQVDPERSRVGFELQTRWGQVLAGDFNEIAGEVAVLPDGRRRVQLRLATRGVEIEGHSGYTRFARGGGFFDVEHWPTVTFESEPYPESLLVEGGRVAGTLTIRGISRREAFTIAPAQCDHPGVDCDVVAGGVIDRNDYGMGRWRIAIRDAVRFSLRIRIREPAA